MRFNPLLAVSYELSELPDRDSYLQAARVCLAKLLPGDNIFWLETDFGNRTSSAWDGRSETADLALGSLIAEAYDHPAIKSYLDDPSDLSPRRLSDVSPALAWRSCRASELLSEPMGRHQLSLIVRMRPPSQGSGWTVGRSGSDFTDTQLDLAVALLPLLTTLDRLYERCMPELNATARAQAQARSGLTNREVDILLLVADGLTAEAIGHVRRISVRTVRKHLEHAYLKLGCHDRLMAVQELRKLGLTSAP